MADWKIEQWNNEGKVYLWHYRDANHNYHGHHLTADDEGCQFLLGLVKRFRETKYPARKKFALAIVGKAQLAVPNCNKAGMGCRRLELKFHPEWEAEKAVLNDVDGEVVFEMGRERLAEFERGLEDVLRGEGDWAMTGDDFGLWFWWSLK